MRKLLASLALVAALAAIAAVLAPGAAAASGTACPSGGTPAAGSKVNGGLVVDGTCIVNNVTVDGGITVTGTGHLQLYDNSTVHGGVLVNSGGELDVNALTDFNGFPTGTTSEIDGGVTITNAFDYDLWNATINGDLTISGSSPFAAPAACGLTVNGDVTFANATSGALAFFGDPEDATFAGVLCPGNTISGSLSMTDSGTFDLEGNSIGSASISGSRLEFNGNTIGGNLSCGAGNTFLPPAGPDPATDTVQGQTVPATSPC